MSPRTRLAALRTRFLRPVTDEIARLHDELNDQVHSLRTLAGQTAVATLRSPPSAPLAEVELKVHSQYGEDGIIAHLVRHVPIEREFFVEIGVESYREANTRFLLETRNWAGIAVDATDAHVREERRRGLSMAYSFDAVQSYVTRENIDEILARNGAVGDIGLFSLDIDGVDYWVLRGITSCSPRIVVAEYNSAFGCRRSVTVPYEPAFDRTRAHHSNLYFGASLPAIAGALGSAYQLVGCNTAGNNAFFVRRDVGSGLPDLLPEAAYVRSRFREYRDEDGRPRRVDTHGEGLTAIGHLPLYDVDRDGDTTVAEAVGHDGG